MPKGKRFEFMQNELGAKKKYQVGKYFKAMLVDESMGLQIRSTSAYIAQMSQLQQEQTVILITTHKLTKADIFKLYIAKRYDGDDNF
jgi:hypothetical protein